ncbi:MAG: hypothetical protein JXB32_03150 [Deltaproteobacteria bacterium]|nr:hypothetical protein [Deltaproteobacteria bacterium]
MSTSDADPLDGAALLKLAFLLQGRQEHPNFRVVYRGVLQDLGLTDDQVERHLELHRERLHAVLVARGVIRDLPME